MIPLLVAAFSFGRRGGLILGAVLIPINLVQFLRIDDHFLPPLFGSNFVAAHVVFLVTGFITGSLRDLKRRLETELAERKRIEVERERSTELLANAYGELEAMFDNTLFGIALVKNLIILRANRRALEIMGYDPNTTTTLNCIELFDSKNDFETFVQKSRNQIRKTGVFTTERQLCRKDGEHIWVRLTAKPLVYNTPTKGAIWAFDNIEPQKRLEKRLRNAKQEAETLANTKTQFLATMSHEIRTPLNAVIGMAEMLEQTQLDDEQSTCVSILQDASRLLLDVVNDILDFSALDAGKTLLASKPFDLMSTVLLAINPLRFEAQKKGLRFTLHAATDIPQQVITDSHRVRQILVNLVGNAIKYTDTGEVHLHITARSTSSDHTTLVFDVIDTGIGIDESQIETIFNSFHRTDASLNRRQGGTGLGLAISRKLARLLGGHITVSSAPNTGSHFQLSLPVEIAHQAVATRHNVGPSVPHPKNLDKSLPKEPSFHILLVEDNAFNSKLASMQLERLGHTHHRVHNGHGALVALAHDDYDIVLMDIEMPEMNGLEATRRIRRGESSVRNPHIPIIAMTAHVVGDAEAACRAAGMNGYVVKPVSLSNLNATLREYIHTRQPNILVYDQIETTPCNIDQNDLHVLLAELGLTCDEFIPILHVAVAEIDRSLDALDRAEMQQNIVEFRRITHTLISTSASIGAHSLSRQARVLHDAVRLNPTRSRSSLLNQLQYEVARLHHRFDGLLRDDTTNVAAKCPLEQGGLN